MNVSIEESTSAQDQQAIRDGLFRFNTVHAGDDQHQPVTLVVRDARGQVIGGLLGMTYWGWLVIEILWLDESARGQGLGQQLVARAEQIAVERGCHSAHLDTMSFQAPDFYLKLGYTVWGQLDDLPRGHRRIFLKKSLVQPVP